MMGRQPQNLVTDLDAATRGAAREICWAVLPSIVAIILVGRKSEAALCPDDWQTLYHTYVCDFVLC